MDDDSTALTRPAGAPRAADFASERRWLEGLIHRYHHARYIAPDPLQRVRRYRDPRDREIVGLIAASLAYGNVKAILGGVSEVERRLGDRPGARVAEAEPARLAARFSDFRYRVTGGPDLAALLVAAGRLTRASGSLGEAFVEGLDADAADVLEALQRWVERMEAAAERPLGHLLPQPRRGSACKRLLLYLRWMVRADAVDPGGWRGVEPRRLIAPVDTHMHGLAMMLGWTRRKQANLATAIEVTAALRRHCPADPLRYDFALTRPGIRNEPLPVFAA